MDNNEEKGYGKIVEDLTIDDLKKYEDAGISILLVRKPLTPEVSDAVSKSKMHVYADLDPKTIETRKKRNSCRGQYCETLNS